MRQIWVLGEDARVQSRLQVLLSHQRFGVKYKVSGAKTLSDIPEEHISSDGVVIVVDAFHPQYPGFDGLTKVRARGFKGAVYLLGEPAPEDAVGPFESHDLTAFLPSVDRIDISYLAGLIHHGLTYGGDLNLKLFLEESGKASVENITSLKEFNQLVLKLMNFVSRFGVNIQKLKRTLVGLSASHVKNTPKGPSVVNSFKLCYGIDGAKLIVGVSFDPTKMHAEERAEFLSALSSFKTGKATGSRTGFFNVAKISSNLAIVGGSAFEGRETESFLLTSISFAKSAKGINDPYSFAWAIAHPTEEMDDALMSVPVSSEKPVQKKAMFEPSIVGDSPDDNPSEPEKITAKAVKPVEPQKIEDQVRAQDSGVEGLHLAGERSSKPTKVAPAAPVNAHGDPVPNYSASDIVPSGELSEDIAELHKMIEKLQRELHESASVSRALSDDVKRLMKERREPLTDADLKESLKEVTDKAKRLQEQNKSINSQMDKKDSQIELLKAQVERLKLNVA